MKDYFRSNKYSIRKFTIGTGSVLIASFFFLSYNEVLASETISKVENPVEGNKVESPVEGNKVENPVEGNKVESPVEGNKVENPVEGNKVESPVEGNKVESPVEGNKVESPVEGNKVENSVEGNKVESPVERSKVENSVEGNKVESPVEGNKVESPVERSKVENSVEGNKVESPVEGNKVESPVERSKVENSVEGNKVESPVEGNKVVNVPSNSKDNEALLNNKVLATNTRGNDLQTSFRSTFMNRAVAASNSGKLVNDSVHFENLNFRDDRFDANQGEGTRLRGDFKVTDNSIRKGDYFNIKLPDYLNLYGNTSPETVEVPQLDFNNSTIATGIYNIDTNEITYTFTENIEGINNVKGSIDLAMFADRKNAPNSDYYDMHVDAAGETLDKQIKIDYFSVRNLETPLANIESFIVDTTDSKYEQYVYVNPKGSYIGGSYVQISDMIPASNGEHGRDSSSARLDNIDNISIYKVNSNQPMNESFYVDEKIYEDVTENIKRNNDIKLMKNEDGSNTIGIDFRGLLSDGSRYIIKVNGKNISGNFPETRVLMETYDRLGITSGYSWDNQVFKDGSSSDISGEHNNYEIGDYVWEDTNKDGVQNREEKGLTGVTVILKDKEGNEVNRTQTNEEGKYLFTNVKNGDYVVEFETPEGYEATKQNVGSKELDSDGQVVNVKVEGSNNYTIDSGFVKAGVPNTPPTTPEEPGVPNTPPTTPEEPGVPNTPPTTPEEPGVPNTPPTTPEEPGVPNTPPTTPEEPGVPNTPPTTPEEPGVPNTPPTTPEEPGVPNTPPTTPEEPGVPNTPPTTPEEPGVPNTPPTTPEESGVPNTPPTTPEESGVPNTPPTTPEEPGVPNTPPTTPEEPGVPNTPPTTPEEPGVPNKTLVDNKSLPDTGSETSSNVTGGLLMTILGSVLILLRGRRKESK